MSENYKIMSKFIKDISGETPDIETYLYVKDFIYLDGKRISMSAGGALMVNNSIVQVLRKLFSKV